MSRFLLNASGTDAEVLKLCPSERINRTGMGAMVLLTSGISTIAFSLQIQQVFHCSWQATLPFALGWGIGIFNIDRWLVGTIRVGSSPAEALKACWVRLALSLIIGAWTSDAIVLRTFEPEITHRLTEKRMMARQESQERVGSRPRYQQIGSKQQEIDNLNAEIKTRKIERDRAEQEMIREIEGQSATRKAGYGIAYREKRAAFNTAQEQYESYNKEAKARIASLWQEVQQIEAEKQAELGTLDNANRDSGGHAAQLRALGELVRSDFFVGWGVMITWLLLTAIDCLPILVKIGQAGRGNHPYDTLRDKQESAEIKVGGVIFQSAGQHKAEIESERLKIETESARRINQKTAKDLEAVIDQAIQTIYIPEAQKEIERQMRQQVAKLGKIP
jgi:hypothetical protein